MNLTSSLERKVMTINEQIKLDHELLNALMLDSEGTQITLYPDTVTIELLRYKKKFSTRNLSDSLLKTANWLVANRHPVVVINKLKDILGEDL